MVRKYGITKQVDLADGSDDVCLRADGIHGV